MVTELSADNAGGWLARQGVAVAGLRCSELGGGISNKVVLAEGAGFRAVLKQSLGVLRTEAEWRSDRGRIAREGAALRWMEARSAEGSFRGGRVPKLILEEPASFTLAMEAAPPDAAMWKTRLFRGEFDGSIAARAGTMLGSMIAGSWRHAGAERLFGDQTVFEQLRIDPSYRFTAQRRPEVAEYNYRLIERSAARRVSLVHGDWSPKNLLVSAGGVWAIDWEVIHYGDPSFDAAFLLNHLLMKSIAMPAHVAALAGLAREFLGRLAAELPAEAGWVIPAAFEHVPSLLMARVAGKSPAEYLDAGMRRRAEALALDLMRRPADSAEELFSR